MASNPAPEMEHIRRLLEIYTLEEILEFNNLEDEEALELLIVYGAVHLDNIP